MYPNIPSINFNTQTAFRNFKDKKINKLVFGDRMMHKDYNITNLQPNTQPNTSAYTNTLQDINIYVMDLVTQMSLSQG